MSRYSNREQELLAKMAHDLFKTIQENKCKQSSIDNKATENLDAKPDDMTNGKDAMCDNRANRVNEAMNSKRRTFLESQKEPKKEP